eukprot:TRINITY_DN2058_c0_g1_i1.p1 TRINITY_DN2058_c0_g1~~TRINITY_DN2058_c0_g1_i1.p1  ORF type:complete len:652 (-),score=149.56 TRINITY_DN2058_c0_g1_i1:188-2143(-)
MSGTDPKPVLPVSFPTLHPSETIYVRIRDTQLVTVGRSTFPGDVFVTNYQLIWKPDSDELSEIRIPLMMIFRLEKIGGKSSKGTLAYILEIHSKDFRIVRLAFKQDSPARRQVFDHLMAVCFSRMDDRSSFAFTQEAEFAEGGKDGTKHERIGWSLYDCEKEYTRQGALWEKGWRLCEVNKTFEFCETYPTEFVVPEGVSDKMLQDVGSFRSKSRIPVLAWFNRRSGTALIRSAQPMVGILRSSSKEDQELLLEIQRMSASETLKIIDLRPRVNAMANQAKGAGYESSNHYPFCELQFMNIDNIHVMRESFRRLMELCLATGGNDPHWWSALENTNWMSHIRNILAAARVGAEELEFGKFSVLAHCSDGWDRTSQVVSLIMIMLDGYYRTRKGFAVLIEKDWLGMGHKFAVRLGHNQKGWFSDGMSPVFIQFLDCVYQLIRQYPAHFEFNERYLMDIVDSAYSGRDGTFLFETEKDRHIAGVRHRTPTTWDFLLDPASKSKYINPLYRGDTEWHFDHNVILPEVGFSSLSFWDGLYLRYCRRVAFELHFLDGYDGVERLIWRGKEMLSQLSTLQEVNASMSESNMTTVQTFQTEIQRLMLEIEKHKKDKESLEKRLHDTGLEEEESLEKRDDEKKEEGEDDVEKDTHSMGE